MTRLLAKWLKIYEAYVFPMLLTVIVAVWVVVKLLEILATKRSRLTFLSRCRKLYFRMRPKSPLP